MFEPAAYRLSVPKLFKHLREQLGDQIELLHDMHERLAPIDAIGLAKELEPYRLFFLEDPFAPEDVGYFKILRQQCATPIAIGGLWVAVFAWQLGRRPLIPRHDPRMVQLAEAHHG